MATNRPDTLDPALLRPGRLDRKIEIALPNEQSRLEVSRQYVSFYCCYCSQVIKIHANPITKHGEIDFEAVVKLSDGFSCADLRNVCTEAGKDIEFGLILNNTLQVCSPSVPKENMSSKKIS